MTSYFIRKDKKEPIMNETTRAYIYRVLLAVLPLLTAYGLIDEQVVPLIVALVAAILSTGLAAVNTSTSSDA